MYNNNSKAEGQEAKIYVYSVDKGKNIKNQKVKSLAKKLETLQNLLNFDWETLLCCIWRPFFNRI